MAGDLTRAVKGRPRTRPIQAMRHFGACPECGKDRYVSKKVAKLAARQIHPGKNLRAFPCGDYWHYGAPPVDAEKPQGFAGAHCTLLIVDEACQIPEATWRRVLS